MASNKKARTAAAAVASSDGVCPPWGSALLRRAELTALVDKAVAETTKQTTVDCGAWGGEADTVKALTAVAEDVLNSVHIVVGDTPCNIEELEIYCRHDHAHPDVFTHGDERQLLNGKWYFHRMGKGYKGGSYKGVDIAFGTGSAYCGLLIRAIRETTKGGRLIEGSCKVVDYMLDKTGYTGIESLVSAWEDEVPSIWSASGSSPLHVAATDTLKTRQVFKSPRVGLSMKTAKPASLHQRFVARPYRLFTEPKLKKGKLHSVVAMHETGLGAKEIASLTGGPQNTIQKYIDNFDEGKGTDCKRFFGLKSLDIKSQAQLFGACHGL
eukprot:m.10422 g.10422  ORF g.10422 m.10422 type:complete len:325 (+) comp3780_c0_seq2:234-1208(+)